eukprot:TRINITY_DN416_c0_g2_i1.p1 TRINITY_DN416_c0_g2~~TRINITY_DN416_c0_g2_i1.p1  ORF type:complete len:195 (-),score=58.95 TRINITY_DN416_c0_g2_i1:87-671(-)
MMRFGFTAAIGVLLAAPSAADAAGTIQEHPRPKNKEHHVASLLGKIPDDCEDVPKQLKLIPGQDAKMRKRYEDCNTKTPYTDFDAFGRQAAAQKLTEESVSASNAMVDQIEKAEVAEEKRSVFRALTHLRGAAIAAFDGVAKSQSANINEYTKQHKWREDHPIKHLANEEADVKKWAFPENADMLLQLDKKTTK